MGKVNKYDGIDRLHELEDDILMNSLYVEDIFYNCITAFRNMPIYCSYLKVYFIVNCN